MPIENENLKTSIENTVRLQHKMTQGLNWFYWIAGLSIINSILFFTNTELSFIAGLGITQVVDVIFSSYTGTVPIGYMINSLFIIGFIALGVYGKRRNGLAILGIVLYSLDTIIFIYAKDWFSFGFHIFAIVGLISGLKAKKDLDKIFLDNPETIHKKETRELENIELKD